MRQKNTSVMPIFSVLIPILLLLIIFSGCVQNSTSPPTVANKSVSQSSIQSPVTSNIQPINITINSVFKTIEIHGARPYSGNIFIIINMTIENREHDRDFLFNQESVLINNAHPITEKLYTQLTNPLYFGSIPGTEKRTGEIVFGINKSIQLLTFKFLDNDGKVIFTQDLGNIIVKNYSPLLFPLDLLDSKNFSYVIENLDTPAKAAQYTNAKFFYETHGKCTSYSPEEFFLVSIGDCKDYATFLSYLLAYHGYDAKIISYSFYQDGKRIGHVVTLFTDTDGRMKYATTPDVTIFRDVISIDDLLNQECSRMNASAIAHYRVLPAGSLDTCVQ